MMYCINIEKKIGQNFLKIVVIESLKIFKFEKLKFLKFS